MAVMLVVGGAGFLGSHLVEALLAQLHVVRVLDNLGSGSLENLRAGIRAGRTAGREPASKGQLDFVFGDVRDADVVRKAARGVQTIFHHAACHQMAHSLRDPLEMTRVNVDGTLNILRAAQAEGIRRVVFASSWQVYGRGPLPFSEAATLAPHTPYAASKAAAETYCRSYWEAYGLETICLRYFSVYGPRQNASLDGGGAVPRFVMALRQGVAPTLYGDGRQTRDFVFVDDAVRATLAAATAPGVGGRSVNVASGRMSSLREVLEVLGSVMKRSVVPQSAPARPWEVRQCVGDITLARALLDYSPEISLAEGLRRTIDAFGDADRDRVERPREVLAP